MTWRTEQLVKSEQNLRHQEDSEILFYIIYESKTGLQEILFNVGFDDQN